MDDTPYEQMTDAELKELTEQVVSEHESGAAPLRPRDEAVRVVGTVPISLRIPGTLLERIKAAADEHHMPYQRLIKTWLEERLARNAPPKWAPKPVRLRLTAEQLARLRQSGLDIHLEAS